MLRHHFYEISFKESKISSLESKEILAFSQDNRIRRILGEKGHFECLLNFIKCHGYCKSGKSIK